MNFSRSGTNIIGSSGNSKFLRQCLTIKGTVVPFIPKNLWPLLWTEAPGRIPFFGTYLQSDLLRRTWTVRECEPTFPVGPITSPRLEALGSRGIAGAHKTTRIIHTVALDVKERGCPVVARCPRITLSRLESDRVVFLICIKKTHGARAKQPPFGIVV